MKYARFDKGFGGENFYLLMEKQKIGYAGKMMKWTKRLAAEVAQCRVWKRYVDEDWIIEGIAFCTKRHSGRIHGRSPSFVKPIFSKTIKPVCYWIRIGNTKRSSPTWIGKPLI